jgi:uncharacterized protein YifN (PemK superfamily)
MALKYPPKRGSVVKCDFTGHIIPEMVKVRPVVVLATHPDNKQLVTVVPISTTESLPQRAYHHKISENPLPDKTTVCWAKCDMIATVSLARLDLYQLARLPDGTRQYVTPVVDAADFDEIQKCVKSVLGLK